MALMSSELYDALLEAGASEAKARKAAEAVAAYDNRFMILEGKIDTLRAEVKGEMAWTRWLMGTNIVLTLGVLWRLLK
jgi:hypothetical protein